MKIDWNMPPEEIERESFRRIEAEMGPHPFSPAQWIIVRRLIHATADFSLAQDLHFGHSPIEAGLEALRRGAPIFCDSNMIRGGLSLPRLRRAFPGYKPDSIHCRVADPKVMAMARERRIARSLAALELSRNLLAGCILLVGNAPLVLAGAARMIQEENLRPALVIGMPVGFVHVVESKEMIMETSVPHIVLKGRRGGSPLAVATLHAILENLDVPSA
ncbi:MAG: precorrin-8X methylmutase [Verrucomicrobiae bacterium]|nr:precorrin-8X methylmutase [Verrucomicrobiae bacterium]